MSVSADGQYGTSVNDIHSRLNPTRVCRVERSQSIEDIQRCICRARRQGRAVSIAGGRHAMGGQQFGTDTVLLDMSAMTRVLALDHQRGHVSVEAGIYWPDLIEDLLGMQRNHRPQWGIVQKQTGADRLSIGGAVSANVHGRGLALRPIVADVESLMLVDAQGELRECSRRENTELFRLAIGGYGLFGVITTVTLRLTRRAKLQRLVEQIAVDELIPAFQRRIDEGFLYGDFQYATDSASPSFLREGIFSCYRPVSSDIPVPEEQKQLSEDDWKELAYLAHTDRRRAFELYSRHYLATSGQMYWSDTHQLSTYLDDYHDFVDQRTGASIPGSEMITEVFVPRSDLVRFVDDVREGLRAERIELIYGTIRLIEKEEETFLPWARESYVCVVFNVHVPHTAECVAKAARDCQFLIDRAIAHGGRYFLTYHRWARRDQVEACYPEFPEFLRLKRKYDAEGCFQSNWYRHYKRMFVEKLT
jgi:FAD/FMN-containing dehydrogenase